MNDVCIGTLYVLMLLLINKNNCILLGCCHIER